MKRRPTRLALIALTSCGVALLGAFSACGSATEGDPVTINPQGQAGSSNGHEGSSNGDEGSSSGDEGAAGAPSGTPGPQAGGAGGSAGTGVGGSGGTGGAPITSSSWFPWQPQNSRVARVIYLVPSDQQPDPSRQLALELAIKHLQIWVTDHLGSSKAFSLHDPAVETVMMGHDASWYSSYVADPNADAQWQFYTNVTTEGRALVGAIDHDPSNLWSFFTDAQAECGQVAWATAGGVLVADGDSITILTGGQRRVCSGDDGHAIAPCEQIGLLGYALFGALGVDCGMNSANCDAGDLAVSGAYSYPDAKVGSVDQNTFGASPFFATASRPPPLFSCSPLM